MIDSTPLARLAARQVMEQFGVLVALRLGVCVIADASDRGQGQRP